MAAVIFDHSTLSAVQRLTGAAPAPSSYDAHGDYSALENFFQNLIFFDDYYFVDDYKEEFSASRAEQFSFLHPIPKDFFPYGDVEHLAIEQTKDLILDIRAGRQRAGLLKEFLEEMNLHLTCAWHMQSSDFFLTLKILADEPDTWSTRYKYSPLTAMIFQELSRGSNDENPLKLISSSGDEIPLKTEHSGKSYVVGGELRNFSNCLNWLARRTAFYTFVSAHFDAATGLHPIRHNFLSKWAIRNSIAESSHSWRQHLADFFGTKAQEAINAINASSDAVEIGTELPLFAAWALGSKNNVNDALSFILDVCQKPEITALRGYFREIDDLRERGEVSKYKTKINELRGAIEKEAHSLTSKYGAGNAGSTRSVSINAQILPLPKLSFSAKADLGKLKISFGQPRHVRALLRNVVNDVVGFESLGNIRYKLLRAIKKSKDFTIPALRIEEKRFFGRSSDWKEPM